MLKLVIKLARASFEAFACLVRGHWEGFLCELFLEGGFVIPALLVAAGYVFGRGF